MFVPKSHGGLDVDFPTSMEIIEALATANGSAGWVVMIGSETPMLLALLSRKHFDRLYANTPDVIIAGAFAPRGQCRGARRRLSRQRAMEFRQRMPA